MLIANGESGHQNWYVCITNDNSWYIDSMSMKYCIWIEFWTGAFYAIAGGIGFAASQRPSNCIIINFMALSLFSSIFALPLIATSVEEALESEPLSDLRILYGLQLLTCLSQGFVTIIIVVFTFRTICKYNCTSSK